MKIPFLPSNGAAGIVKLAISPKLLASLIESGQIHASDFRCLDLASKKAAWEIFLSSAKLRKKTDAAEIG